MGLLQEFLKDLFQIFYFIAIIIVTTINFIKFNIINFIIWFVIIWFVINLQFLVFQNKILAIFRFYKFNKDFILIFHLVL